MMTDKIMIDNVDVSGCGFYHKETGEDCHIALAFSDEYVDDNHTYFKCKQNPNCNYKQLMRETAKNNELSEGLEDLDEQLQLTQNQYNAVVEQNKSLQQELQRKEEECEKTKKSLGDFQKAYSKLFQRYENKGWSKEYDELISELQAEQQKVKELEKLLKVRMEDLCDACGAGSLYPTPCQVYKQALEEIKEIAENLIVDTPEYHDCYYKDECGANCTPKKEKKIDVCMYEQIDKILQKCEVLND